MPYHSHLTNFFYLVANQRVQICLTGPPLVTQRLQLNWVSLYNNIIVRCSKVFADFHFHHHQSLFKHNIHCCQSSAHHLAVSKMRPCFLNSLSIALCQVDLVPFDVTRSAKVPQSTIKSFNRIPIKKSFAPLVIVHN